MKDDTVDEMTAINMQAGEHSNYGTNELSSAGERGGLRSRPSQKSQKSAQTARQTNNGQGSTNTDGQNVEAQEGFWTKVLKQFGSLELENKGSVARDHLALGASLFYLLHTTCTNNRQ